MQLVEIVAAILGLVNVGLTVKRNIFCWPVGLAMVICYAFVFFEAKLYSDMLLQVVYVILQLYGWHAWLRGGPDETPLAVSRLGRWHVIGWLVACLLATAVLGTSMHAYTDASFPYIDVLATVASLIAQWLLGRKVLETWLVWIFVDVISIGLYTAKELYPTAILYAVFLGLATWGWFEWRNVWRKQATA